MEKRVQTFHLLGEGFIVIFNSLRTHIAARSEHIAVLHNLFHLHRPAESGQVVIVALGLAILSPAVRCDGHRYANPHLRLAVFNEWRRHLDRTSEWERATTQPPSPP
jgi:hypothetical protein